MENEKFNQTKYQNDFIRENYDRFSLILPKGLKKILQEEAKEKGMSLNAFVFDAIEKYRKK